MSRQARSFSLSRRRRSVGLAVGALIVIAVGALATGALGERRISHSVVLDAPPAVVWAHLEAYPERSGDPFLKQLAGSWEPGASLTVAVEPMGGSPMRFEPTVLTADRPRELAWRGRLWVPGVVDGTHRFQLRPLPGGRTRLTQSERFTGVLVPFLGGTAEDTEAGFAAMHATLAQRISRRAG